MKDILIKVFSMGCYLSITREMGMCHINVTHLRRRLTKTQILPIDHHLDNSLIGAIEHCLNEVVTEIQNIVNHYKEA